MLGRMVYRIAFLLGLVVTPVAANEVLSPEYFENFAEGKTLFFDQAGRRYGVEQYLPGRQSIWQFADGTCKKGIWYARKELICFLYEGDDQEQCWQFLRKGPDLAARAEGNSPKDDLIVVGRNEAPISCRGPDVGV